MIIMLIFQPDPEPPKPLNTAPVKINVEGLYLLVAVLFQYL